jgi:SAM-dependent methyltransferase
MQQDSNSVEDIIKMSDNNFIDWLSNKNSFNLNGNSRRFKYRTSNENIASLIDVINIKNDQVVLSVSGSGVQVFEMISDSNNMPRMILSFDYSPKQVAYNYLLKSAVSLMSFEEFQTYFGINSNANINLKVIRSKILKLIPYQFRSYLLKNHNFGKRDISINEYNHLKWIFERDKYNTIKENIDRVKFFKFEVSHHNANLFNIFGKSFFDVVYLSNVLDWVSWHNKDISDEKPIEKIFNDIKSILKKDGYVVLSHLTTRESFVEDFIAKINVKPYNNDNIYKYKWLTYKIHV